MATTRPKSSSPAKRKPPARKVAGDFDDPFRAPSAAERRRMDAEQSAPYREAYEAGKKAGKVAGKPGVASSRQSGKTRRRRPPPGAKSARAAARQLQAPVRAQVTSGLKAAGLMLAVVALYNVLTKPGPEALSGVFGGVSRGLTWLSSATPVPKRS